MKICHVITRMIVGGAQENTLLSIRGQLEAGHEVTLVTGPSPGREGELLNQVSAPDFPVKVFPELVRNLSPHRDFMAWKRLREYFRSEQFDVVHTHSSKAGIIGRLSARAAGVPVVVHTVHGQAFHPYQSAWRNRLYIALEHLAAKHCDRIFAVSQAMIDQCVAAGVAPRGHYRVVYSGMETAGFAAARRDDELRRRLGFAPEHRVIVTLARLFPQKGYEYVFPAAAAVMRKFPETRLLVIGDGPEYDRYHARIRELGIESAVCFAGLIPPREVPRYLVQGDLLWHLSLHEGLPRAVVQALAAGIPAIGFALDGTPEVVIDGETGFVTSPGDTAAVTDHTLRLWSDEDLRRRLGETGQKRVMVQFDWRRMCGILEHEYRELLNLKQGVLK